MRLHILKESQPDIALDLIRQEAKDGIKDLHIALIQNAVELRPIIDSSVSIYVLEENLKEKGASSPYPRINTSRLLELIFQSENVITW